jgi:hypothetical protein
MKPRSYTRIPFLERRKSLIGDEKTQAAALQFKMIPNLVPANMGST